MNRSRDLPANLAPPDSALQHGRSPRPLPLFLEMVRLMSERDPELARKALVGLAKYEQAPRDAAAIPRSETGRVGSACLRDHGGIGSPAVLIPSLINPPNILDLDAGVSLASAIAEMGRKALLLDWGEAEQRAGLSVSGHIEQLLVPLLEDIGEPATLIGYCLGGTMAIAAANLVPAEGIVTLAAPWHFTRYPAESRANLQSMWRHSQEAAKALGQLPMEVLQASFWSLDPERTVAKFADFAGLEPQSPEGRRFVVLEDWANEGEPLPYPTARELIEDFFDADLPGRGEWQVGGRAMDERLGVPLLHCTASRDRITPAATAPEGPAEQIAAGHVGMIVGSARTELLLALGDFLTHLAARPRDG